MATVGVKGLIMAMWNGWWLLSWNCFSRLSQSRDAVLLWKTLSDQCGDQLATVLTRIWYTYQDFRVINSLLTYLLGWQHQHLSLPTNFTWYFLSKALAELKRPI